MSIRFHRRAVLRLRKYRSVMENPSFFARFSVVTNFKKWITVINRLQVVPYSSSELEKTQCTLDTPFQTNNNKTLHDLV